MDQRILFDGLAMYLAFIVLITFHEFGHAWTALKCGDDTPLRQGRVSLNPLVHIDMVGSVVLPLLFVFIAAFDGRMGIPLIGWAKPVQINWNNLKDVRRDDTLITLAGPLMNLVIGFALMIMVKAGLYMDSKLAVEIGFRVAEFSIFLCYFNLLPFPPLDGSHIVRNLSGMSFETYLKILPYGFFMIFIGMQLRPVQVLLSRLTDGTLAIFASAFGL
jgi:Zn-dependent protease